MKILADISMFFIPAIFLYIVHVRSVYRKGGGMEGIGKC